MFKQSLCMLLGAVTTLITLAVRADAVPAAEYHPRAEKVAANVYALVGPLGQRSRENDGLNANYGLSSSHGA